MGIPPKFHQFVAFVTTFPWLRRVFALTSSLQKNSYKSSRPLKPNCLPDLLMINHYKVGPYHLERGAHNFSK